ncbi:hypothetical protein ACOCJ5_05145 [Knoellia sp. CPCC 206450]|uniref:hypothetical protein n=1 Tax=Knoellia tibetensis TaxID=3404798 RepID=UPI003B430C92
MSETTSRRATRTAAASNPKDASGPKASRWDVLRRTWPWVAVVVALLLWWPAGYAGRAEWMHLPLMQMAGGVAPVAGGELFLGSLVAAAVVSALVAGPWPRFGAAAGLTAVAWVLSDGDVVFASGERVVLAALAALGMLIGLGVGARALKGAVSAGAFLALVSGLSPATWSRGLLLAVAVALPFWVASSDRVAPTVLAVVRVVVTWLVAVVVSTSLWAGFGALRAGQLADPKSAAPVVWRGFIDNVRERGLETVKAAPQVYTGWIWVALALAVVLVVAAAALRRRRASAS